MIEAISNKKSLLDAQEKIQNNKGSGGNGCCRGLLGTIIFLCALLLLAGCGKSAEDNSVFRYGTTVYSTAMGTGGLDPRVAYQGWSAVRYGVGETLVRLDEHMALQPWLAERYEISDAHTVKVYLRKNATFANGKAVTGDLVKAYFESLMAQLPRAAQGLQISRIEASELTVSLTSQKPAAELLRALADPSAAIIDINDTKGQIVVGTGPYKPVEVTDKEVRLVRNETYWGEKGKFATVEVKGISDGDTLTMALQNGDIDAAQGLPYASLQLFKDPAKYTISAIPTSRVYQGAFNFKSPAMQDIRVRKAISMALDKASFVKVLLQGNGVVATGPFPATVTFGGDAVHAWPYNPVQAKALLAEAGYSDSDGDGYVDKDGKPLTVRWLTYTSRQELPLLAEFAQGALKEIGIKVEVNATDAYKKALQGGDFDIFAKSIVTTPLGDPAYYFETHLLAAGMENAGAYYSESMETMARQLEDATDEAMRAKLGVKMAQQAIDDGAVIYVAHLKMSLVMKKSVQGLQAHPTDFYELSSAVYKE